MAVTVKLLTDKTTYNVGEKIVARYEITGVDPSKATLSGSIVVDGQTYTVSPSDVTITHAVTQNAPTAAGLTFTKQADGTWTATANG